MKTETNINVGLATSVCLAALAMAGLDVQAAPRHATPKHAPDAVLVRFKADTDEDTKLQVHALLRGHRAQKFDVVPGLEHIRIPNLEGAVQQAIEILAQLPCVQYVEPDYAIEPAAVPNDPGYSSLWGLANINAPAAWDTTTGSGSVVVAIIDSGIDYNHPDLANNIWTNPGEIAGNGLDDDGNGYVDDVRGWNFVSANNNPMDGFGHGTHVAGTVGAVGNDATGVVGVNWQVKLMPLKVMDDAGNGYVSAAVSAINYAVAKGAKISNNSWGGYYFIQSLYDAIKNARNAGHVFVAAAGNGGSDYLGDNNDVTPYYPAGYDLDNIIAVTAIDSTDNLATFGNYGPNSVELAAPGVNILSTTPYNTYGFNSGTSMATPHVAGAVALLWSAHPTWTYRQVRGQVIATVRPLAALQGKTITGGTLDAGNALNGPGVVPAAPTGLTVTAVGSNQVDLAWIDASVNEAVFVIEQSLDSVTWTTAGQANANGTSYTVTNLTTGTTYYFRVQAWNGTGLSGVACLASATTLGTPPPPPAPQLRVASITMSQSTVSKNTTASAVVKIVDGNGQVVSGATVTGQWRVNGALLNTATGTTGSAGTVTLKSSAVRNARGKVFQFCVTNVTKSGYDYASAQNVETCDQITIP